MKIIITTLNAKFVHASLALRYLRSYCEKDFPGLELVEYTINDLPINIMGDLYERKPDVIAFSCYIWNIRETQEVIKLLKKVRPDIPVIVGGPEVSYDSYEWMKREPNFDFIVMGEGEATFHELLHELRRKRPDFSQIAGITYRDGDKVKQNFPRPNIDNLNDTPSLQTTFLQRVILKPIAQRVSGFKSVECSVKTLTPTDLAVVPMTL